MSRWVVRIIALGASILYPVHAHAQGGPPMITDDPDTPGDGHWEINIAGISEFSSSAQTTAFPYGDVNYGWGERIQLKFEIGWVYASDQDTGSHRGASKSLAGLKWRFLDQKTSGVSVSTYPQLEFQNPFSSSDPEVSEPGTRYRLPIEASRNFDGWVANAELGYAPASAGPNEWFYGLVLAREFDDSHEAMVELNGTTRTDGGGTGLLINAGTKYGLSNTIRLLMSLGHTVALEREESSRFISYLGVQIGV